jgi:uncharacterized membrane protein YjjB (DUF3815 family)
MPPFWFTLLQDAFWSAVAALGFALLFNVPVRTLPACALGGAAGHVLRAALVQAGLSVEAGTLAGATLVGFLGVFFARRWYAPTSVFTVSSAIPLVPGVFAFQAMLGILRVTTADPATGLPVLLDASTNAIRTALILAAIAIGITTPSLLFNRRRPVV